MTRRFTVDEDDIIRDFFGPNPSVFMSVVELDGEIQGYTIFNLSYSSRVGKHRLYMADLCVTGTARGQGAGRALVANLAQRCVDNGYERLEWKMLKDNVHRGFYEAIGGVARDEIVHFQLIGDDLSALAQSSGSKGER